MKKIWAKIKNILHKRSSKKSGDDFEEEDFLDDFVEDGSTDPIITIQEGELDDTSPNLSMAPSLEEDFNEEFDKTEESFELPPEFKPEAPSRRPWKEFFKRFIPKKREGARKKISLPLKWPLLKKLLKRKTSKEAPPSVPLAQTKKAEDRPEKAGIYHFLFSTSTRPRVHRYFLVLLALVLFLSLGQILGFFLLGDRIIKPITVEKELEQDRPISRNDLNFIYNSDIFALNQVSDTPKNIPKKPSKSERDKRCLKSDKKTNFPYFLANTIVLQDASKSVASVQLRSERKLMDLREGDIIEGRARIDRIARLRVIIKNYNNGLCEYMVNQKAEKTAFPSPAPPVLTASQSRRHQDRIEEMQGIQSEGNKISIKKDFLNKQLSNLSNILTQALAVPVNNPDGSISFRISEIEPGSIFSYLNIQNGDLISEINGKPIQSQNEVLNLFAKLKTLSKLKLTINRDGSQQELDYMFK